MAASSGPSIPFADPPWLNGLPSPYYTDSHRKWQQTCRKFIQENLTNHAMEWERAGDVPPEVWQKFAANNFLIPNLPAPLPVQILKNMGIHHLPGDLRVEDFDYIHYSVYAAEMYRSGLMGPTTSLVVGISFGVPPIYKFGNKSLQERFLPDFLTGKTRSCLAITEPGVGSDVANIETTAERSKDGKHYILNGAKKWITNGIWADYATMAVRTGRPGPSGISLLLVPLKGTPGVTRRRISTSGSSASGTTFIELDDVKVPVENLIGEEGLGLRYTLTNFNHERLSLAISGTVQARRALSAAFEYCLVREAFGKPLMEQAVVRHRLASSGALLEAQWAWVEQLVYQLSRLSKEKADSELGGLTGLAKVNAGKVLNECSQCAMILFGGNGITRSGKGELVEMISREVGITRIPGGSEDVLIDLAARQLVKLYQNKTKQLQASKAKI